MSNQHQIRVRLAQIADAQPIARIHVTSWQAAYQRLIPDNILAAQSVERRLEFWRKRLAQPKGAVFVAEREQGVCGFCDLIPSRDQDARAESTAEIAAIYISPSHWRKGAGRALCERALEEARLNRYQALTLWVLAANVQAKCFYEAMGFGFDGMAKTETLADRSRLQEIRFRILF